MPANTVCVTRGTAWGNPFKVGVHVENNQQAVDFFHAWINGLCMPRNPGAPIVAGLDGVSMMYIKFQIKRQLRGKNLACYCKLDSPCHADILLKIANEVDDGGR